MAGAVKGGLRPRLLLAFVLVAVPPVAALAAAVSFLLKQGFEAALDARLESSLDAFERRLTALRGRFDSQVGAVAAVDLPAVPGGIPDRMVAEEPAQRRELPVLELVAADGRVVSSHHWPAGFGLPDPDSPVAEDPTLRVETVGEGYGSIRRLALVVSREVRWRGAAAVVRGGGFVDRDFLSELTAVSGVDLAWFDARGRRWFTAAASPASDWNPPVPARSGDVTLEGVTRRWRARPLTGSPSLWLLAATPRTSLDQLIGQVRQLTALATLAALAGACAAAWRLSARIARPIRDLSLTAHELAAGRSRPFPTEAPGEIGELARSFQSMTTELEASQRRLLQAERVAAWREMARRLAHELKNPLFPIQVSIETLQRAQADGREVAALLRESTETILDELRALRAIIDEFSRFARLPEPRVEPVDVQAVLDRVLSLHHARGTAVVVEKSAGPPMPALADADLLARALGNLVQNAFEAMPAGGRLRVAARRAGAEVAIDVEDTGPGLTPEQQARLFTPYLTTKPGGTGLGLAIVQGIVADLGGRVEFRSVAGEGTTFTVVLRSAAG